jgi:putative FmdB family regulatory protein
MPIYDYVCSNCRHRVEVIHGINDEGPRFCPSCGADGTMRKALVSPAIHFKGSGWAKKDRSSTSGTRPKSGTSSRTGDEPGKADGAPASSDPSGGSSASDSGSGGSGSASGAEA